MVERVVVDADLKAVVVSCVVGVRVCAGVGVFLVVDHGEGRVDGVLHYWCVLCVVGCW